MAALLTTQKQAWFTLDAPKSLKADTSRTGGARIRGSFGMLMVGV